MPTMPKRLPRRAVSCLLRPPSARMNSIAAARYATVTSARSDIMRALLPEHREHALRDEEAAGDVDGGEQRPSAPASHMTTGSADADLQQPADDDDAADGVGDAHQRRVQRRRDVPDDLQPTKHASTNTVKCARNAGGATGAEAAASAAAPTTSVATTVLRRRSRAPASAVPAGLRRGAAARRLRRGAADSFGGGRRPRDLAVVHDRRAAHDFVVEVDDEHAVFRRAHVRRAGAAGSCA